MPTGAEFEVGQVVGDYEIIGKLGRGGMGAVYKVRNVISHRVDAMKVLLPDIETAAPDAGERFLREIRVHASLRHPNIAQLLTAFRMENRLLMVMELVEGAGLDELLKMGPMDVGEAVACVTQVLSALSHAHALGVVHRDVKPSNIVVLPSGEIKLLDFGIAQATADRRLTLTGLVVGSISYMSPEQVVAAPVDHRSDLYSVGITLYQALTGEAPFRGSEYELMRAHATERPRDPSELNAQIPRAVSEAVLRALEKRPADRFQSADEFRVAIAPYARENLTGLSTLARRAARKEMARDGEARPTVTKVDPTSLDPIAARLAAYVGPIAGRLVATASRRAATIDDVCKIVAEEIEDRKDRAAFLAACGSGAAIETARNTAPQTAAAHSTADAATIDGTTAKRAAAELAQYIGPLATVLVQRAIKRAQSPEQLYEMLSTEIASEQDRRKFLSARR